MGSRSQVGCGLRNKGEVQIRKLVFPMVTVSLKVLIVVEDRI